MRPPAAARLQALAAALAIAAAIDAPAGEIDAPLPRIRAADARMRALVDEAVAASAIVRALVGRIAASDVVVFVACDADPAVRAPGRLNFMAAAGGLRYVVVRLKPAPRAAAIAMLAHELQHAVEIADAPSIVDEDSLAREYARIGYRSQAAHGGVAYDTQAAVDVGRRVKAELRGRAAGSD